MNIIIDTPALQVGIEDHPQVGVVIHATVHKWSHTLYKVYKEIFNDIILETALKNVGCVTAPIADSNTKLQKFAVMFGFTPTEYIFNFEHKEPHRLWQYIWLPQEEQ
jgi:hypothetical protein